MGDDELEPLVIESRDARGEHAKAHGFRNLMFLSFSFLVLFSSFSPTTSSFGKIYGDWAFLSMGTLYTLNATGAFFAPYLVFKLGKKLSLVLGASTYALFAAACIDARQWTLITAAGVCGVGASLLWTAQGAVITASAPDGQRGRYNGIFFATFLWNLSLGNSLAGVLVNSGFTTAQLFGVLTGLAASSILGLLFVRPLDQIVGTGLVKSVQSPVTRLTSVLRMLAFDHDLHFLAVLMVYSGLGLNFFYITFPNQLDKDQLNYVIAVLGIADVLGSLLCSYLSDKIGRKPILLASSCFLALGSLVFLFYDTILSPGWHEEYIPYLVAIMFGLADCGYATQIPAIIGDTFTDRIEAGFATFKFIQTISGATYFFISRTVFTADMRCGMINILNWVGLSLYFLHYFMKPKNDLRLQK